MCICHYIQIRPGLTQHKVILQKLSCPCLLSPCFAAACVFSFLVHLFTVHQFSVCWRHKELLLLYLLQMTCWFVSQGPEFMNWRPGNSFHLQPTEGTRFTWVQVEKEAVIPEQDWICRQADGTCKLLKLLPFLSFTRRCSLWCIYVFREKKQTNCFPTNRNQWLLFFSLLLAGACLYVFVVDRQIFLSQGQNCYFWVYAETVLLLHTKIV